MLYAAYGTELNLIHMKYRCRNACIVGKGVIHGWRLAFKHHADIIKDNHSCVPVLVWRMPKNDIKKLDLYHGYPHYYMSTIVDVDMQNGNRMSAFVYVMKNRHADLECPTDTCFNLMEDGYTMNDIELSYLYEAKDEAYYESMK